MEMTPFAICNRTIHICGLCRTLRKFQSGAEIDEGFRFCPSHHRHRHRRISILSAYILTVNKPHTDWVFRAWESQLEIF